MSRIMGIEGVCTYIIAVPHVKQLLMSTQSPKLSKVKRKNIYYSLNPRRPYKNTP